MSGIAAVFHRDGRDLESPRLGQLMAGVRHRGPDAERTFVHGPVGLGHALLAATPEDVQAPQPVVDRALGVALVLDGRLDDRAGLARDLDRAGGLAEQDDATLVLAAYARWGTGAFARLIGDFAVVIWDGRTRQLLCARDPLGVRPLFYRVTAATAVAASSFGAIARATGAEVDEGAVAEWLSSRAVSQEPTLFQDVRRLLPGQLLVVDASGMRLARYWSPDGLHEIRYPHEEDYAERVRELLEQSVTAQMRTPAGRPVGLMLSGGLDSGLICATAGALGRPLSAFTMSVTDPRLDETRTAGMVAAHVGRMAWSSVPAGAGAFDYEADASSTWELPTYPTGAASLPLRRQAVAHGVRAMLTGVGGDEWFTGNPSGFADLLVSGQWRTFLHWWRHEAADPESNGHRGVWVGAFWPLVPEALKGPVRRVAKGQPAPPWITPALARRVGLADRLVARAPRTAVRAHAVRSMIDNVWSAGTVMALEDQDRLSAECGLEDRHPFLDRRLVEFALALPETVRRGVPGVSKPLLRRVARGRLPASVVGHEKTGDFSLLMLDALRRLDSRRVLDSLTIADRGWVVAREARRLHDDLDTAVRTGDLRYRGLSDQVWSVVALELWHRAVEGRPSPVAPVAFSAVAP